MVYRPQKEPSLREAAEATRRGGLSQKLLWIGGGQGGVIHGSTHMRTHIDT